MSFTVELFRIVTDEFYPRTLLPKILLYAIVELYLGFYRWTMLIGDSQIQARIYIGQLFKEYE